MQKPVIKAVVFDLYNTLVCDSGISPLRKLFSQLGFNVEESIVARRIVMTEKLESFEAMVERLKPGAQVDITECNLLLERAIASTMVYSEVKSVLAELKKRGLAIGLISNLSANYRRPFFELGLADYFDQTIFSFEFGSVKPDPLIYKHMISLLGLRPEEIIMTGDQISKDVEAPRIAGMQAVHLDRSGQYSDSIPNLTHIFKYL